MVLLRIAGFWPAISFSDLSAGAAATCVMSGGEMTGVTGGGSAGLGATNTGF